MIASRPHLRLLRAMHVFAAPAVLLALWLPDCNEGDFRTDTGLYAALSKLMYAEAIARGSLGPLWFPMLGDAPYFNKPPLAFWVHGAFIHVFGAELWAVRLPTLLAAMLGVAALQRAVMTLAGRSAGLFAGVVLATTLEFFRYTRAISLDIWLVAFMLLALAVVAPAVRRGVPCMRRFALAGGFIGLGLLVKPLYALALPAVIAVWLMWSVPRGADGVPRRVRWMGAVGLCVVVALVVAAPWYLSMYTRWGDAFIQEHFIRQTLERAVNAPADSPERSGVRALLYLPTEFASTYWPWLVTLALALFAFARRGTIGRSPALDRLGIVWSVLFAAGLMLFAGKRSRYMVPLYPGLAMLSASWLSCVPPAWLRRHARRALTLWAPALPVVALGGTMLLSRLGVTAHQPPSGDIEALQKALRESGDPVTWVAPGAHLNAARLYVKGSAWPRALAAPGLPLEGRDLPRLGDVVLYSSDALRRGFVRLRAGDDVVIDRAGMTAARAARGWTIDDVAAIAERAN
ncbi:MAG: ArnT family glycosyltransferase [Phycisphaerales bacterium]